MSKPNILFIPRVFDPDQSLESLLAENQGTVAPHRDFAPAELEDGHEAFSLFGPLTADDGQSVDEVIVGPVPEAPRAVFREYVVDRIDTQCPDAFAPDVNAHAQTLNIDLLPKFVDTSRDIVWPAVTNIHCWWCVHGFVTRPVPCVSSMRGTDNVVFRVEKVFCSFNCMKAFALNKVGTKQADLNIISANSYFFRTCHFQLGLPLVNLSEIKPAAPRESLKIFGGPLTIQAFRQNFYTLPSLAVLPVPMISSNDTLEWMLKQPGTSYVSHAPTTTTTTTERKRKHAATVEVDLVEPEPVVGNFAEERDNLPAKSRPTLVMTQAPAVIDHHLKKRMSEATARFQKAKMEQQGNANSSMLAKAFQEQVKESAATDPGPAQQQQTEKKSTKKSAAAATTLPSPPPPTLATQQPTLRNFLGMDDD